MSLLTECKVYLDITDNDRDEKIKALLKAGYSSMTNTADVVGDSSTFDPTSDAVQLDQLVAIALFIYVAGELEPDPDQKAKLTAIYERKVHELAMSSAFGDYSSLETSGG